MKSLFTLATALALLLCISLHAAESQPKPIRVLIWDEQQPEQKQAYGDKFLGETIAAHLRTLPGLTVKTAHFDAPEQGVDEATLDNTDVIIWWAHRKSTLFTDEHTERVTRRVRAGQLGFIGLHSAHWAKPFVRLMQNRAKADALAQIPAAERASVKWEYLNENPIYKMIRKDAPLTSSRSEAWEKWRSAREPLPPRRSNPVVDRNRIAASPRLRNRECTVRIKYLKVFVDLAESGSFSEAASRHGISQPAVSQQIGCLEEDFATPLVERSRRRFRLTPAGEALFVTAKEGLRSLDSLRPQIATLGNDLNGTLHVVTTAHLGVEVVPALTAALKQAHPGITLTAHYQPASRVYADVAGNVADFGLLCCPKPDDRFETAIFAEESFLFVTTPQAEPTLSPKNLRQRAFIGYNPDPSTAQMISQTLREVGPTIVPAMEFDHPETVLKAVHATHGFACLPATAVQATLAQGQVVDCSTSFPKVTRQLGAIFYKQRMNHPVLKTVRESLEQLAGNALTPALELTAA